MKVKKLSVDEKDNLSDALTQFKNPSINYKPLQVRYRGQPAIDTGKVCRQFFTTVHEQTLFGQMEFHPYLKLMLRSYSYLIHTLQLVKSWWQLVQLWHIPQCNCMFFTMTGGNRQIKSICPFLGKIILQDKFTLSGPICPKKYGRCQDYFKNFVE